MFAMSGKPANVGASRAGVAGAPRVLVYVAEQRQLEPGTAPPDLDTLRHSPLESLYLPDNLQPQLRSSFYRTQSEGVEQRSHQNQLFYKNFNDSDDKIDSLGSIENITQLPDLYPVSQQYVKDSCIKVEETKSEGSSGSNYRQEDCAGPLSSDLGCVETFSARLPVGTVDTATQLRCVIPGSSNGTMPHMQQMAIHHGQNQFCESVTVQSGEVANCSEQELSIGKSYVNYQFLEQSVSHQSIVNQSISILNQQVGVNNGIANEVDSSSSPQLVRTADGVVLAVLPAPVVPSLDSLENNSRNQQSEHSLSITVPLGWRRIVNGASVLYISPSGTALSTLPQLREYLQTAGTCKCGLPCPLRPEMAFSFDPKVISKPYQAASEAESTKLCNHKRKLLATLQSRSQSPATPPPQNMEQKRVMSTEIVLKKKTKRRGGLPTNVTMSQVMVQRELSLHDVKFHDTELNREIVQTSQRVVNNQPCPPSAYGSSQQNLSGVAPQGNEMRHEAHPPRSSHYLTVNSGWISQHQEKSDNGQSSSHSTMTTVQPSLNGTPVLGSNGQIIGVNTGYSKYSSYKNNMAVNSNATSQELKDEKKEMNIQHQKHSYKEEESQMFCGLNQALTPEVMQKINEQQHIFIQQNQKQIEMAMKGFRSQLTDNGNQNKSQNQNQYNQAQLVIQNGAVVKTNPAKTPPWQVKRNESANSMTSPGIKASKSDNLDSEEANTNVSEDSSSSYSSFSSEQSVNHTVCSRVPPLPQHYSMLGQHWPVMDTTKKRNKPNSKGSKKKNPPTENKMLSYGNNGVRLVHDSKGNTNELPNTNVPSFMDDPNGYLAQQTVLLNNTISRQVGINATYESSQYDHSVNSNCFGAQNSEKKSASKSVESSNVLRSYVPNHSLSPTSTPDSSVLSENTPQCCKGCNVSRRPPASECNENQSRFKYSKHNIFKLEHDNTTSSTKNNFEDNPITSTFVERCSLGDNNGPIQAATVSTSSITETLQLPEPSPTLSNSSRNTDTPHSSGCANNQALSNSMYTLPSPAYSNTGSGRDSFSSNPSTPGSGQMYPYNSPGPPVSNQSITGTQMLHFISNHNVNKNLMEVDNISTMVGVKSGTKTPQEIYKLEHRHLTENAMPGYCPPPHLGGGPAHSLIQTCYVQTFVTTMASGFSVTRDTVTSVLAGKAKTATTSINASQANFVRPPPPPSVNLATSYAIPNNQPDPFINSVNLPTSYPLHIAGTTAQNMISKSPLEMVQNVIGNLTPKSDINISQTSSLAQIRRTCPTTPGQILISSTGQIIVSNNHMPPPPPKTTTSSSLHTSSTNVSASVTQVIPAVGGVQSLVNQPAVVVNTLRAPFVLQPSMMAVDGQVVQQNAVLPQIVTGGIVSAQSSHENARNIDVKNQMNFVQGVTMVSPESIKKRSKKKKNQTANITSMLQIAAPQQNNNLMVHHSSPQHNSNSQFSPRSFQLSPNNNISPTPMLQALTIVPGKSGTPAHIVMNGQSNNNSYGSQQILANTSPSQQINLLQPVNLINNAGGVMPNFPAFQQFIVPNLGGMVMTADGAALIQDNSAGMPMQLQLQAVNGQNVLTPVQNSGVFTAGTGGSMVIRAQNQQGKMIQSQHSPGAQFLSPNGQVMMNSPNFNGQLSPMLANLSPTNVTFGASPQLRPGAVQSQEFLQTNQSGQTLMVPMSPKQISISSAPNRASSTFVQNTTIVQQQTTLVSNSSNVHVASVPTSSARLNLDPNLLLGKKHKGKSAIQRSQAVEEHKEEANAEENESTLRHVRHSVSTQTLLNQARNKSPGSSPPDTTTHSPLGADTRLAQPDTTTESPEPADTSSSAMVQCVSSSEQDMTESRDQVWPAPNDFPSDTDSQNLMSNVPLLRANMSSSPLNCQTVMPAASAYYERMHPYKRKNEFGDGSSYRSDKIMRTNGFGVNHGLTKDLDYSAMTVSSQDRSYRHYQAASDRHNFSSGDDAKSDEEDVETEGEAEGEAGDEAEDEAGQRDRGDKFARGQVVWGPAPGHASWPGQLERRRADGRWEVRWFGARGLGVLHPARLLALSDGLDAHHAARERHRKSRKLNTLLENAIQEAMAELDKNSGTGASVAQRERDREGDSDAPSLTDTPKKSRKRDKSKNKEKKKSAAKISRNKPTDTRLRSSQ
ncbi:uncharacterized protein LOC101745326 isoform X2 [Bombyx mori]|uniref:uncharacterized protein LOC101745326 isoform X2 n=1 Tax=Bombyx mori TaxID=7091 RepID=UPI002ED27EEF